MADKDISGDDRRLEHVATNASAKSSMKEDLKAADMADAQQVASEWVEGTEEEKRLKRKLDWRILPCCWVLYLLGFLDRGNVGYVPPRTRL